MLGKIFFEPQNFQLKLLCNKFHTFQSTPPASIPSQDVSLSFSNSFAMARNDLKEEQEVRKEKSALLPFTDRWNERDEKCS